MNENNIDEAIIIETYRKVSLDLEESSIDITNSGCTCVSIIRFENKLICISLGDSRAILYKDSQVYEISKTHKPDQIC